MIDKYNIDYAAYTLGKLFGKTPIEIEEKFSWEQATLYLGLKKFEAHCEEMAAKTH